MWKSNGIAVISHFLIKCLTDITRLSSRARVLATPFPVWSYSSALYLQRPYRLAAEQTLPSHVPPLVPCPSSVAGVVCFHTREKIPDVFKKLVIEGFLSGRPLSQVLCPHQRVGEAAPVLNKDNKYIGMVRITVNCD